MIGVHSVYSGPVVDYMRCFSSVRCANLSKVLHNSLNQLCSVIYIVVPRSTATKAQNLEVTSSVVATTLATQIPEDTSPHVLTSKTSTPPEMTLLSIVTTSITETWEVASKPVAPVTTTKTLMVTSTSSTRFLEIASSSYVISSTLQTPEGTHLPPIILTAHTLMKTTPRSKLWTSTTHVPPKIGRKRLKYPTFYRAPTFTSSTKQLPSRF